MYKQIVILQFANVNLMTLGTQNENPNLPNNAIHEVDAIQNSGKFQAIAASFCNRLEIAIPQYLADVITEEVFKPTINQWLEGEIDTLGQLSKKLETAIEQWYQSDKAKEGLWAVSEEAYEQLQADLLKELAPIYHNYNISLPYEDLRSLVNFNHPEVTGKLDLSGLDPAGSIWGPDAISRLALTSSITGGIVGAISGSTAGALATFLIICIGVLVSMVIASPWLITWGSASIIAIFVATISGLIGAKKGSNTFGQQFIDSKLKQYINANIPQEKRSQIKLSSLVKFISKTRGFLQRYIAANMHGTLNTDVIANELYSKIRGQIGKAVAEVLQHKVGRHIALSKLDVRLIGLYHFLLLRVSLEDIRTFCFEIQIDYEEIDGEKKSVKLMTLLEYCAKREMTDVLIRGVISTRPDLSEIRHIWNSSRT